MTIDATFWVAISFFIFLGGIIYLKVPQKINDSLTLQINKIKGELNEAEKLKIEAKTLLANYESKIDKSKKEAQEILNLARKESEKNILEKTNKFYQLTEIRKKDLEKKIVQLKENSLRDIRNISVKISIKAAENIINNSVDKNKLENFYTKSLEQTRTSLKKLTS